MQKAKQMANQIKEQVEWELERFLSRRRKDIDRKYVFRVSRLTQVFGILLFERRISEEELRGLEEDQMKAVRSTARVLLEEEAA